MTTQTADGQAKSLGTRLVPIGSLKPYRDNANVGDMDRIRESIRTTGQYRAIVVWNQTQEILAGNHTWKAMQLEGHHKIRAEFIDCDALTARRINLVDNESAKHGQYDLEALVASLGRMPDLTGTGFSGDDLDKLTAELVAGGDPESGADPVPEDAYDSQLGVIVLVESQQQQQAVYEHLKRLVDRDQVFAGVELKVVAV